MTMTEAIDDLVRLSEAGQISDDQAVSGMQLVALSEIAARIKHQLRLVAHVADSEPGIQPYCTCGWIGDAGYAYQDEELSRQYRAHLEDKP